MEKRMLLYFLASGIVFWAVTFWTSNVCVGLAMAGLCAFLVTMTDFFLFFKN